MSKVTYDDDDDDDEDDNHFYNSHKLWMSPTVMFCAKLLVYRCSDTFCYGF